MQVTAEAQTTRPPRVSVTVTGSPEGGHITVYRLMGQQQTAVRGLVDRVPSGGAVTAWDLEQPLNRPFSYRAVHTSQSGVVSEAVSAPLTLQAPMPWLIDPISAAGVEVAIQTWPSKKRAGRKHQISISGTPYPAVMSDMHQAPESQIVFLTRTEETLSSLMDLLEGSSRLLLRPTGKAVEPAYLSVNDIDEERVQEFDEDSWVRLVSVSVQEVAAPPASIPSHGDTLLDLHEYVGGEDTTLADIVATFGSGATLLDIARTQLRTGG